MNGNKHKARIICAILTVLMIFSAGVAQTDQSRGADQKQTGSKEQFIIQFSDPLSPAEVIDLVKRTGVTPKELLFEFPGEQDDVITAGYVLNAGDNVGSALQDMVKKHKAFLKEGLSSLNEELSTDSDSVVSTSTKKLKNTFEKMLDEVQKGNFKLRGLKASGGAEIAKLTAMRRIKSVVQVPQIERRPYAGEATEQLFVPVSYYHESWAPYSGTAKVTQGLTFQTFYFNKISAFDSTSTYEHETQIYNKSFADFANYWTSNLPSAYLDTPFLDTIDNFTVGTARAANLQTFTKYHTHVALKPGSAATATVRIKGQKGYRNPSWCTSKWCILATRHYLLNGNVHRTDLLHLSLHVLNRPSLRNAVLSVAQDGSMLNSTNDPSLILNRALRTDWLSPSHVLSTIRRMSHSVPLKDRFNPSREYTNSCYNWKEETLA